MLRDDPELLDLMLADMERAPALYRPTNFWQSLLPRVVDGLRAGGLARFRADEAATAAFVPTWAAPEYLREPDSYAPFLEKLAAANLQIDVAWRRFLAGTPEALADLRVVAAGDTEAPPRLRDLDESELGGPLELQPWGGRRYSRSFVRYLKGLVFLKHCVDTRSVTAALELGGGFGSLGEILLKSPSRDYFYVDVDIPPVAYVATRYLAGVFGDDAVCDYRATRELAEIDLDALRRRHRAVVLCPWQLPRVRGQVELFANFVSFQEMEPEVVRNYADLVSPLCSRFVLLRNSAAGKPGTRTPIRGDDYPGFFPDFELVGRDADVYGTVLPKFRSEVMVLRRRP